MPGLFRDEGSIAIVDDGAGVAGALVAQFAELGVTASVLANPSDIQAFYGVIYLGGLRKLTDVDDAMAINHDAFVWARASGRQLTAENGLFVTVQDTGGDFGLGGHAGIRAWSAGLPALVKTARLEWPTCVVKAIDMERGTLSAQEIAARIVAELTDGGPEIEVGLKLNGQRIVVVDVEGTSSGVESPETASTSVAGLTSKSVLVVSGGARGVTAACLQALAAQAKPKLVLLGRTTLATESPLTKNARSEAELARALLADSQAKGESVRPKDLTRRVQAVLGSRAIEATIESLHALGIQVKYIDVDVQDEAKLRHCLHEVRNDWGPITGVIHAAGVIADKPILEKTDEQFERVFATKVRGLQSLLRATADDPLQLICLFSSIAARAGNVGQSDYAMANEVLNKVAAGEAADRPYCLVKSIGWGAWEGGMVTPSLRAHFEQLGVPLIPIAAGAEHFVEELSFLGTEVVVVPEGTENLLERTRLEQWSMELIVNEERFACLADHVIFGSPVVPVAFVIDWFTRAAQACRPGLTVRSCDDVRVMKGIRLDGFANKGRSLYVVLSDGSRETARSDAWYLPAELRSEDGTLHYQAIMTMISATETVSGGIGLDAFIAAAQPEAAVLLKAGLSGVGAEENSESMSGPLYNPYSEHLFHGPAFQAIANVDKVADSVVTASLKDWKAMMAMASANAEDIIGPVLLDAGLQVARLWGIHRLGKKTLPTSVHRCFTVSNDAPVRCIVVGQSVTKMKTVTDVYLLSDEDHVVSALLGLEMHVVNGKES